MLRFIALIVLFIILFRVVSYFVRLLLGNTQGVQGDAGQRQGPRRTKRGNLNVDHVPQEKRRGNDTGDYIDYEEVKE